MQQTACIKPGIRRKYVALLIALLALMLLGRALIFPAYINPSDAIGLTQQQARERFGMPDEIIVLGEENNSPSWVYYHGIGLRGSALHFKNGKVDSVDHRER